MALYSNDDRVPPQKSLSIGRVIRTGFLLLLLDVVVYGTLLPLIGTCIGGWFSYFAGIPPRWELVLVVILTFCLMYGTFCLFGEASYWKSLFAFEPCYSCILQIRDLVNAILLASHVSCLFSTVQAMIFQDKNMKKEFVSEGALYVYLKSVCNVLYIDHSILLYIGLAPPHAGTFTDPSLGANEKFLHGASYMLLWAMMSACVAKLVYFNTLFTYLHAMEIFISMKPSFVEDDDSDEELAKQSSATTFRTRLQGPSRLENDFACSVKRTNTMYD